MSATHGAIPAISLAPDPATPDREPVNPTAAQLLPERACRHFRILAVGFDGARLTVAMADPADVLAQNVAFSLSGRPLEIVQAPPAQIERAIDLIWPDSERPGVPAPDREPDPDGTDREPGGDRPLPEAGRLGGILVLRGLIDAHQLAAALERQRAIGSRLGEILHHEMGLAEDDLAEALADQLRMPLIDLDGLQPQPEALAAISEPLQRRGRCVPLAIDDEVLYVAMSDPLDDETYASIRELTELRIRTYMATRSDVERMLGEAHREVGVRAARGDLLARFPEDSANRVLTAPQRVAAVGIAIVVVVGLALAPLAVGAAVLVALAALSVLASLYKVKLAYESLDRRRELAFTDDQVAAVDDRELPRYTILVPLLREAGVVERLVENLARLDYPRSKLEIILLCEGEDTATIEAIAAANPDPHFRVVVVPDSRPKTKPKACNYGLQQATGAFVVVYDAEDQPEPDQLKKVLLAWGRSSDDVVCVQTKLNYFNAEQNLLTRFFAAEYALWFELLLPGLGASGAPIPLGGTSNHFDRDALVALGAWDPFNVTEDADLGVRLHKAGYRTVVLDSTTFEEANSRLGNWIRQRSRWVKGYMQTYLVHMRHPIELRRAVGWGPWWSFQLIVGATALVALNPIFWILTALWLLSEAGVIGELLPAFVYYAAAFQLVVGNFAFAYLAVAGSLQRRLFHLVRYAAVSPIYWALMSVGAWLGLYQLCTRPFYWEKTDHGFDHGGA